MFFLVQKNAVVCFSAVELLTICNHDGVLYPIFFLWLVGWLKTKQKKAWCHWTFFSKVEFVSKICRGHMDDFLSLCSGDLIISWQTGRIPQNLARSFKVTIPKQRLEALGTLCTPTQHNLSCWAPAVSDLFVGRHARTRHRSSCV